MQPNRLIRFSIYQLMVRPTAGMSQLLFIVIISKYLIGSDLMDALYLLSLGVFFIFLDFGTLFNAYREASINLHSSSQIKHFIITKYQRQSLFISGINFLISIPLLLHSTTFLIGIYIAITAFTIPGLVSMHLLRGFGKDFHFTILFNLSWPISLVFLVLLNPQTDWQVFDLKYLALLPSFSTIICGLFAIIACAKLKIAPAKMNIDLNKYTENRIGPIFAVISGALAFQIDKIFVIRAFNTPESENYLVCGILMFSTISSITAVGSIAWGSNLSSNHAKYNFHFKDFTIIGAVGSSAYLFGMIILKKIELIVFELNYPLLIIFSFTIIIYVLIIILQAFATFKNLYSLNFKGNLIQILTIIVMSTVLQNSLTINLLAIVVASAAFLNLTYLVVKTRDLISLAIN